MLALYRCAQTWTVLREFVRPGWTCLQREVVDAGIIASAAAVTDRGFINVDIQMRTNLSHIFPVGDIVDTAVRSQVRWPVVR
jgi:hypothetical protein